MVDFLFDLHTMYGFIWHRFHDKNYFRSRRNRNCSVVTLTLTLTGLGQALKSQNISVSSQLLEEGIL